MPELPGNPCDGGRLCALMVGCGFGIIRGENYPLLGSLLIQSVRLVSLLGQVSAALS